MGRRRFLGALTSVGVSGAAAGYLDSEALSRLTDDPSEEVPRLERLKHPDYEMLVAGEPPEQREPIFYTIPRDEWAHVEGTKNAAENVHQRLRREIPRKAQLRVGVRQSSRTGPRNLEVVVKYTPTAAAADLEDRLKDLTSAEMSGTVAGPHGEETVDGIPVQLEATGPVTPDGFYDYKYRPVPAGCQIRHSGGSRCTSGTPVVDNATGIYLFVTAGHCTDEGETVRQPRRRWGGNSIGTTFESEYQTDADGDFVAGFDAATIDTHVGHSWRLAENEEDGYRDNYIWGSVAWDYLSDHVGQATFGQQGRTSGRRWGSLDAIYPSIDWVECDTVSEGGDSGGPVFDTRYNSAAGRTEDYIVSIHSASPSDADRPSWGTAMASIESQFDVRVW